MDSPFSHNYSLQRRPPRHNRTSSFTANASGTVSAEDPFTDRAAQSPQPATDPFASPRQHPRSASALSNSTAPGGNDSRPGRARYFHSRRVRKDEVIKPWVKEPRDPAEKWIEIIPLIGLLIGISLAGLLIWDGLRNVVEHKYCPVLDGNLAKNIGNGIWHAEEKQGGFGNGEFDQTMGINSENVFVKGGNLIIKATAHMEGQVSNITETEGSDDRKDRYQAPVYSGRMNTKGSASIKYGRVEVVAKMPKGDWLWPAIWMMPVHDTYGPWPASGEIDIAESRGNNHTYSAGGNNVLSSTLHWGPEHDTDRWWQTSKQRTARHSVYSDGFNTFGLEWSQKYIFTYLNNRLMMVMYTPFAKSMWKRGMFPPANSNGSALVDPWSHTGRDNTPFDQEFYLVLNLAVGGTNGWFEDGKDGKPWADKSKNAVNEFWNARNTWYPTWTQPYMEIKKVTMLQQCDGDEQSAQCRC